MNGNILVDLHHSDLYYSLYLLLEKRLGYTIFRPIGLDWKEVGYWKHFTDGPYGSTSPCLKDCESVPSDDEDGVYYCYSQQQDYYQRAITLDKFKKTKFDIIISTLPCHWISFNKLITDLQPQAKHIAQIGNIGPDWLDVPVKNVMSSVPSSIFKPKEGQNVVHYNPEFDLNIFKYHTPKRMQTISSFIHCLPERELFERYRKVLSEFTFNNHGIGNEHGNLDSLKEIAIVMNYSTFGWMVKFKEGYGFILHNWLACGRPVITRLSDYPHRKNLLIPGQSCIDLDAHSFERNVEIIRECSEPEVYKKMCEETHKIFEENVDFDKDTENVKKFLDNLG